MKLGAIAAAVAILALAGCGGSGGGTTTTTAATATGRTTSVRVGDGKLPPGAVGPVDTAEQAAEGPAAAEASPEAEANGPRASGELPAADRSAVSSAVASYIAALDRHDAAAICRLLVPGGLEVSDLPARRTGCRGSLTASIGTRPANGGPAWRRTSLATARVERLTDDRARVSATVVHHFADRRYVSVEDDVIYLERHGDRWLLAKPSATFYRAVGYAQPPLRAFGPPADW